MNLWDSEAERRDLVRLRHGEREWNDIALALNAKYGRGRTPDSCSGKYHRMRMSGLIREMEQALQDEEDVPTFDELVVEWNRWLKRRVSEIKAPAASSSKRRRIGITSDMHCPFENRELLAAYVAEGPYDLTIVGGDLLDYNSVSTFVKREYIDIEDEIKHGTWVLELLAANSTEVEIILDNHSHRIMKVLSKCPDLPWRLVELLKWNTPEVNILQLMSEGLDNVKIAKMNVSPIDDTDVRIRYMVQEGDLIVAHPDMSRKHDLTTPRRFAEDFLCPWEHLLGIHPWRVLALAHTHGAARGYWGGGAKMYLELGAAVTLAGVRYAFEEGRAGYRPFVPIYTTLEQERDERYGWRTDMNSVKQVLCQ